MIEKLKLNVLTASQFIKHTLELHIIISLRARWQKKMTFFHKQNKNLNKIILIQYCEYK